MWSVIKRMVLPEVFIKSFDPISMANMAAVAGSAGGSGGIGSMLGSLGSSAGGFLQSPGGGMLGSSVLGALGQGFSGDEESKQQEKLIKAKRKQQELETQQQMAGETPTNLLANYMARDMMLQKQGGPGGDIGRLLNTVDFTMNQAIPYLQGSNFRTNQAYHNQGVNIPTPAQQVVGGINKAAQNWQGIRERIGQRRRNVGGLLGGGRYG